MLYKYSAREEVYIVSKNMKSKNINIAMAELKGEREGVIRKIIEIIKMKQKIEDELDQYKMFPSTSFFDRLKERSIDKKTYSVMSICSILLLALFIFVKWSAPFGSLSDLFSVIIFATFLLIFVIFLIINIMGIFLRKSQMDTLKTNLMLKDVEIEHYEGVLRELNAECGFNHEATMRDIQSDIY